MSRVGKQPVSIPARVKVGIQGKVVSAEGPKGKLTIHLPPKVTALVKGDSIQVERSGDDKESKSMHGLARALVFNLVSGVSVGYQKKLEIQGVGFKASVQGDSVNLALGFSHPIIYRLPAGVKVTVEDNTKLLVDGASKQDVGRVAAEIRSFYPPEPYKGKGVRYSGEVVKRKEGKTVQ